MHAFNPSGRIPFLRLDDGTGFEDTDVIVPYLDALAPPLRFEAPGGDAYWPYRRLEAMARGMLDGLSVWAREVIRPAGEQSPTIIEHERRRSLRLADFFEGCIAAPPLAGRLNTVQLLLFCALDLERRLAELDWRGGHPGLIEWHARMLELPSIVGSAPPEGV